MKRARPSPRATGSSSQTARPKLMSVYRNDRLASILRAGLGKIIGRDYEWSDALVTITSVSVDKGGLKATVKVGIIPKEKELECYNMLTARRKEMEHKLLKSLRVRRVPTLVFQIQNSDEVTTEQAR